MASVFAQGGKCNAVQEFNGAFCADNVKLKLGSSGEAKKGALVQSAEWQCERTVNMLYEIGSSAVYYVGNRRRGTATFTRVVSGSDVFKELITKYGNICEPDDITIDTSNAACGGGVAAGGPQYVLKDATLNLVGGSVNANDVVVTERVGFMFADLDYL